MRTTKLCKTKNPIWPTNHLLSYCNKLCFSYVYRRLFLYVPLAIQVSTFPVYTIFAQPYSQVLSKRLYICSTFNYRYKFVKVRGVRLSCLLRTVTSCKWNLRLWKMFTYYIHLLLLVEVELFMKFYTVR